MSDHVKKSIVFFEKLADAYAEQADEYRKLYQSTGELWAFNQARIYDASRDAYQTCANVLKDEAYFTRSAGR